MAASRPLTPIRRFDPVSAADHTEIDAELERRRRGRTWAVLTAEITSECRAMEAAMATLDGEIAEARRIVDPSHDE